MLWGRIAAKFLGPINSSMSALISQNVQQQHEAVVAPSHRHHTGACQPHARQPKPRFLASSLIALASGGPGTLKRL